MSKSQDGKRELAREIAKAFGEEEQIKLYQHVCLQHEEAVTIRAYNDAKKVPSSKIRKSRSALFHYLLKKYAQNEN